MSLCEGPAVKLVVGGWFDARMFWLWSRPQGVNLTKGAWAGRGRRHRRQMSIDSTQLPLTSLPSPPEWTSIPNKILHGLDSDHHQSTSWFEPVQALLLAMRRQIFRRACKTSTFGSSLQISPRNSPGRPKTSYPIQPSLLCEQPTATRLQLSLRPPSQSQFLHSRLQYNCPPPWHRASTTSRLFSSSRCLAESNREEKEQSYKEEVKGKTTDPDEHDGEEHEFARSEKAAKASHLNLSARLSKEGTPGGM